MTTDTREALAALQRLMPAIEKGIGGLVFTADKAGEIAADMNTLRAALATQPAQPSAQGEADAWRNVLQTLLDIWHCGHLTIRPEAEGYWLTTVEAGEAILGRLDQLASAPAAQPSAQGEAATKEQQA